MLIQLSSPYCSWNSRYTRCAELSLHMHSYQLVCVVMVRAGPFISVLSVCAAEKLELFRGILVDLGVNQLTREETLTDLTFVHDNSALKQLLRTWVYAQHDQGWGRWFRQPIDQIKDMFGQEIALYFAFLGTA